MTAVQARRVELGAGASDQLRRRLEHTRTARDLGPGWERGMPVAWLERLIEDWRSFDVHAFQARLDALAHFRAVIDGQDIHLVCARGLGPAPVPLLLTHGWPGLFLEYLKLIPLLTTPDEDGRSFTVIVPSLPGFGFSGRPPAHGLTARETARLWHLLMRDALGFERYVAHGSDLGAGVTGWLARDGPEHVAAIHLATPGLSVPATARTAPEERFAREAAQWTAEEGGYMHEHATKPATLAAGLSDSPAGLAAWIGEKVVAWSSRWSDGTTAFDRDLLLATLTLYWSTNTIASSLLPYWAYRHHDAGLPADTPGPVPTAITIFGGEQVPFPKPPRRLAERFYNVSAWAEHPVGGHFPAVAEPELLARVLRTTLGGPAAGSQGAR